MLRRDGFAATLRKVQAYLALPSAPDEFDLKYGVDTAGIEPLWKFKIHSKNAHCGVRYQPTGEEEFERAVSFLNEDLRSLTFVDLGCGKGRTLLVASRLGFNHIVGVDFVRDLVTIAGSNLAKLGIVNAEVIHGDAADFQFPSCNFVLYLYNPFSREVMQRVIANLQRSLARLIYVMYSEPKCANLLDSSGFLNRCGSIPGRIQLWKAAR